MHHEKENHDNWAKRWIEWSVCLTAPLYCHEKMIAIGELSKNPEVVPLGGGEGGGTPTKDIPNFMM